MTSLLLIGDVHGKLDKWQQILLGSKKDFNIQVGDVGLGFRKNGKWIDTDWLRSNDFWIHGNHDSYDKCLGAKGFLGRFGMFKPLARTAGVFFVSGADSIDREGRTEGIDWWANEELSYAECIQCLDLYKQVKPSYVISHDCPFEIAKRIKEVLGHNGFSHLSVSLSRTRSLLQNMFEYHQPNEWFFGHWHKSWSEEVKGCRFTCLNELETHNLTVE